MSVLGLGPMYADTGARSPLMYECRGCIPPKTSTQGLCPCQDTNVGKTSSSIQELGPCTDINLKPRFSLWLLPCFSCPICVTSVWLVMNSMGVYPRKEKASVIRLLCHRYRVMATIKVMRYFGNLLTLSLVRPLLQSSCSIIKINLVITHHVELIMWN